MEALRTNQKRRMRMSTPKYKINATMISQKGEIAKLERDGHSREDISKAIYRATDGATVEQRRKIVSDLYERNR
jgi:hypothetical protein